MRTIKGPKYDLTELYKITHATLQVKESRYFVSAIIQDSHATSQVQFCVTEG